MRRGDASIHPRSTGYTAGTPADRLKWPCYNRPHSQARCTSVSAMPIAWAPAVAALLTRGWPRAARPTCSPSPNPSQARTMNLSGSNSRKREKHQPQNTTSKICTPATLKQCAIVP